MGIDLASQCSTKMRATKTLVEELDGLTMMVVHNKMVVNMLTSVEPTQKYVQRKQRRGFIGQMATIIITAQSKYILTM